MNKWTSWSLIEELRKGFLTDAQSFSCGCRSAWRFIMKKNPKWPNFATAFTSLDTSVPCTKNEHFPTCLSVIPVGIWVWGSPPAAQGISHIFLRVSNHLLHKSSILLKNKNSCTQILLTCAWCNPCAFKILPNHPQKQPWATKHWICAKWNANNSG